MRGRIKAVRCGLKLYDIDAVHSIDKNLFPTSSGVSEQVTLVKKLLSLTMLIQFNAAAKQIELQQGRIHDNPCRGQLGRGSND